MSSVEELWEYYYDVALHMGAEEKCVDGIEKRGRDDLLAKQTPFSVMGFYANADKAVHEKDFAKKHRLMAAFLGDESACEEVRQEIAAASCPHSDSNIAFFCSRDAPLDSDKEQAQVVRHVLSQPLAIVQGPPGTGKTKTIANIVSCILGLKRGERSECPSIAIVSTNKEAVRTAAEDILTLRRVGTSDKGPSLKNLYAPLGNQELRKEFVNNLSKSERSQLGIPSKYDGRTLPTSLLKSRPVFGCTLHSLYRCFDESVDAFDYVIVDEGSQVPNYLGLIALFYARHLVVLGDVKQIPPIVPSDRMKGIGDVDAVHQEGDDNSFIRSCELAFGQPIGSDGNLMLRRHYRCEPGIIEFCNQNVYVSDDGEPQLIPMARNAEGTFVPAGEPKTVPIRVVVYEGSYYERLPDATDGRPSSKARPMVHNMRQVQIFVQDEWPRVKGLVVAGKSVCVLSPYRAPLMKLHELLVDCGLASQGKEDSLVVEESSGDQGGKELFQLTIHRAQGKGYDVIYYLSVDDVDFNNRVPWSQKEHLVNVAVSRAREEFCVIVSSVWLPKSVADQFGCWRPNEGWNHEKADNQDAYTLKKLMRYVADNQAKALGGYGFHRVGSTSLFDRVTHLRKEHESKETGCSAPQDAFCRDLVGELFNRAYEFKREYLVHDVLERFPHAEPDDEIAKYLANGARFDLVIFKDGVPLMAVEVDGSYHRWKRENIARDILKNRVVSELLQGATYGVREVDTEHNMGYIGPMQWEGLTPTAPFALVRIPSNGETFDEAKLILDLLRDFIERSEPTPPRR